MLKKKKKEKTWGIDKRIISCVFRPMFIPKTSK